jgi:hypothetical protein
VNQAYRSDEVWSLRAVAMPWGSMMAELRADVHPPLYYWLLRAWITVAGTSEVAARLLSVLLSAAAAFTVHRAAREWFGPRPAALAATIYFCSLIAGLAALFVRMYALLGLASALSLLAFLRIGAADAHKPTSRFTLWRILRHLQPCLVLLPALRAGDCLPGVGARPPPSVDAAGGHTSLAPYGVYQRPSCCGRSKNQRRAGLGDHRTCRSREIPRYSVVWGGLPFPFSEGPRARQKWHQTTLLDAAGPHASRPIRDFLRPVFGAIHDTALPARRWPRPMAPQQEGSTLEPSSLSARARSPSLSLCNNRPATCMAARH